MPPEQVTVEQQEEWLEEPPESELPPRPRRRLLTPVPLALMGVLAIACGFIGGVLVEKGQNSSSSSGGGASGLASRFAALRGAHLGGLRCIGHWCTLWCRLRGRRLRRRRCWCRRLHSPDGRHRCLPRRQHAVCDQRRRQHRQGHDLCRHDRQQDGEILGQSHPPRRNGNYHRRNRLGRLAQRGIDQRRLRRRPCRPPRRLGRARWLRLELTQRRRRTRAIRGLAMQEWSLEKGRFGLDRLRTLGKPTPRHISSRPRRLFIDKGVPCLTPTPAATSPRSP